MIHKSLVAKPPTSLTISAFLTIGIQANELRKKLKRKPNNSNLSEFNMDTFTVVKIY